MNKTITHVYLDMDGVIANLGQFFSEHFPGEFEYGKVPQHTYDQFKQMMIEKTKCDQTQLFKNLPRMPHFNQIVDIVRQFEREGVIVSILTSLGNMGLETNIHAQKKYWLNKHGLGDLCYLGVLSCDQKQYLAHPGALLIDDSPSNCEQFVDRGGYSVNYSKFNHYECMDQIKEFLV